MSDYGRAASIYLDYIQESYEKGRTDEVGMIRQDLLHDLRESPDYQPDAKRNGNPQPMVFTRGGEDHGYNVICLPGDELFAGDIIDAFDEKWIVMRARADTTTHKVGVMYQCNKLLRFQNFDEKIYERWSYVDVSGYSSSFNNSASMQSSAEQMILYLPCDAATEKIYVDKRLSLNVGFDRYGRKLLDVVRVTGVNPIAESFNRGDHILMLKVERDLYDPEADNLDLEVCDYMDSSNVQKEPDSEKLSCFIEGRSTIRLGKTARYKAVFLSDGSVVYDPVPAWTVSAETGVTWIQDGNDLLVTVPDDQGLIGGMVTISLASESSNYGTATISVEVSSLV